MLLAAMISCGSNNEPENTDEITRMQDGDGRIFLAKGEPVSATTSFTRAQLNDALANYEWEREYVIYYDNKQIGDRTDHALSPHKIHANGTIELDSTFHESHPYAEIGYSVNGKKLITRDQSSALSSYRVSPDTLTVVAIDLNGTDGNRMITDMRPTWTVDGFDASSKMMRMVWNGVAK